MFTGIVEELGEVVAVEDLGQASRLHLRGPLVTSDAEPGHSIAVNGVCLTVVAAADGGFTADVMAETLHRSSLGALVPGSKINLERAVRLHDRRGGHVVLGHIDATGRLLEVHPGGQWTAVRVSIPVDLGRYVVEKGSITVDGVSVTVTAVGPDWFSISLIPTTLGRTTLGSKEPGDRVNLEVDILAKHVEKLLLARHHEESA